MLLKDNMNRLDNYNDQCHTGLPADSPSPQTFQTLNTFRMPSCKNSLVAWLSFLPQIITLPTLKHVEWTVKTCIALAVIITWGLCKTCALCKGETIRLSSYVALLLCWIWFNWIQHSRKSIYLNQLLSLCRKLQCRTVLLHYPTEVR